MRQIFGQDLQEIFDSNKDLPSGYVKIAIENDHRNRGFSQLENGGSFHSYVKLPEGTVNCRNIQSLQHTLC